MGLFRKKKSADIAQATTPDNKNWLGRLKTGLHKTSSRLNDGLKDVFIRKSLDEQAKQELEELLITTDMGVQPARDIVSALAKKRFDKDIDVDSIKKALAGEVEQLLQPYEKAWPSHDTQQDGPCVILFCGVNGTGKTTTLAKLAAHFQAQGKSVMMAACDTFRAAAVEQLMVWGKRINSEVVYGKDGADPASVAYQAMEKAKQQQVDILLVDTAGRLHNKKNLMDQLAKITKVIQKIEPKAPHQSIIVLDATIGQNSINQVEFFKQTVPLTGMVISKLDGSAKGGIVVQLTTRFSLPIHAIGVGEQIDDLQPFSAQHFSLNLVGV